MLDKIISLTFGLMGGGKFSLDNLFGIALPNVLVFGVLATIAIIFDVVGIIISNNNVMPTPDESASKSS